MGNILTLLKGKAILFFMNENKKLMDIIYNIQFFFFFPLNYVNL